MEAFARAGGGSALRGGRGHLKDSAGPFKAERGGRIDLSDPSDVGVVIAKRF